MAASLMGDDAGCQGGSIRVFIRRPRGSAGRSVADWADVPLPQPLPAMNDSEATALLRPALPDPPGRVWADLGAGGGTFTRALAALLGAEAEIVAVDVDERALRALRAWAERAGAPVRVLAGDLAQPLPLPTLDGVVMANAL